MKRTSGRTFSSKNVRYDIPGRSTPGLKRKRSEVDRWRLQSRGKAVPPSIDEDDGSDNRGDDAPDLRPEDDAPPPKKVTPRSSSRLKKMLTKTTQAPSRRLPSPPACIAEELEEDELWEKANDLFLDPHLPDLPAHPGEDPGFYILDQQTQGLIPRSLLQNPEAAVAALEDMFRDTSNKPNALQMKAEQAYGTLAARKMVNE
jgi:hypothetical protein